MTENKKTLNENHFVLFEEDFLYQTQELEHALCKPKLLPLKSITLEKLEKMQNEAEAKIKASLECEQEVEEKEDIRKSNESSNE